MNDRTKTDSEKWNKRLTVFDKFAIALAISLGISTFLTIGAIKTSLMALGIIPATYLSLRAAYLITGVSKKDESINPIKTPNFRHLWASLIIDTIAVLINTIVVLVRLLK